MTLKAHHPAKKHQAMGPALLSASSSSGLSRPHRAKPRRSAQFHTVLGSIAIIAATNGLPWPKATASRM